MVLTPGTAFANLSERTVTDGYLIPNHIYLCQTREGVLFLNLRSEKYVGVSGAELQCLRGLVPGWPIGTSRGVEPELSEGAFRAARKLYDAGLLTTDPRSGKAAHPPQVEDGASSLLDQIPDSPSRGTLTRLVRMTYAAITVAGILKFRSLEYAVRRLYRRKTACAAHIDSALEAGGIATLSQEFLRLRPLVYSSRDKCLYDCLVLFEFLGYFELFPTLVIGVMTFPFQAHCWLQYGPLVLTDHVEHVRVYTPILVV